MKKKILMFILVIGILAVALAGCISKPPHKIFSDPWLDYEKITYDVTRTLNDNTTKIKGTSTIITERVTDGNIKVGERDINGFSGTYVEINTQLEDGSIMIAQVAFKSSFEPIASYKNINIKGYEGNSPEKDINQVTNIFYTDEKCYYDTDFDGVKTSGNVKVGKWIKTPYYDNLMLYHIARSSYISNSFSSLTTKVLSTGDFKMKTLTVSGSAINQEIKIFGEEGAVIKADLVSISLNQTFPGSGTPMTVLLSREIKEDYNGLNLNSDRIPLIITEGKMEYRISAYTSQK